MSALALDLNAAFADARTARGMTRKQMARVIDLPERRIEKIERGETAVSLKCLQALAKLPEDKALAAKLFQLEYENQAEMHALLTRLQQLTGGR